MILIFLTVMYCSFLLWLNNGLSKHRKNKEKLSFEKFSIIIAAKNEAHHLPELLNQLINQNYPQELYEIIIINDLSNDATDLIMKAYSGIINLKYLRVQDFEDQYPDVQIIGKKRALNIGIEQAKYEFLVFTDADCHPSINWLEEINKYCDSETDFISGYSPLIFEQQNIYTDIKNLERSSMFAVTAGSFGNHLALTCTARNMIYRKDLWLQVNGYQSISLIPSGDDDLMLLKMRKLIRKFKFMFSQDSIVPAKEDKSLSGQIDQETRRASKFPLYPPYIKIITLFIFVYYLLLIFNLFFIFKTEVKFLIILSLVLKIVIEGIFLSNFLKKINQSQLMKVFFLAEIIYIPYYLFFGLKGTFGKYQWKK